MKSAFRSNQDIPFRICGFGSKDFNKNRDQMDTKKNWLLAIFISTIQLALLLILANWCLSEHSERSLSSLTQQVFSDNASIANNLAEHIESHQLRHLERSSSDFAKLESIVRNTSIPNYGSLHVFHLKTGRLVKSNGPVLAEDVADLKFACQQSIGKITDYVGLSKARRTAEGVLQDSSGKAFLVSAVVAPQLGCVLVVSQPRQFVISEHEHYSGRAKKICFAAILLIGFLCTWLSLTVLSRLGNQVTMMQEELTGKIALRTQELTKTRNAVIFGLAKLAESRDNDTGEHLDRIRTYVNILAKDLQDRYDEIDSNFIHDLSLASSLHDIGKVGIPDSILLKPGALSANERSIMELHTIIGGECLDAIQARLGQNEFLQMARRVAYSHHERWDGTGYPYGLAGLEIPLVARIVAVADVYDALTSKRPYKRALSHMESKMIIVSGSGTQFDPEVVASFVRNEVAFRKVAEAQQDLDEEQITSKFQKLAELAEQVESDQADAVDLADLLPNL